MTEQANAVRDREKDTQRGPAEESSVVAAQKLDSTPPIRDPIGELEEACLRAELRARLMQEIRAWDEFFEHFDRVIEQCNKRGYDA